MGCRPSHRCDAVVAPQARLVDAVGVTPPPPAATTRGSSRGGGRNAGLLHESHDALKEEKELGVVARFGQCARHPFGAFRHHFWRPALDGIVGVL